MIKITEDLIDTVPEEAYEILKDIGYSPSGKGYDIIAYAISMLAKDPHMMDIGVTKTVYPLLGSVFNSTPSKIERAIRHGVEHLMETGDQEVLYKYFRNTTRNMTSKSFLLLLSRELRKRLILESKIEVIA